MSGLLTKPLEELKTRITRAHDRVWIVSPFIARQTGLYVAGQINDASQGRELDARLLTRLDADDIANGFCSPKAIRAFLDAGTRVCAVSNLHAKLYVVDDWAMLGSANLTDGGLDAGNVELLYGLGAGDAESVVARFDAWWELADTPAGRVTRRTLAGRRDPQRATRPARATNSVAGVTINAGEADAGYKRHTRSQKQSEAITALRRGLVNHGEAPGKGRGAMMPSSPSEGYKHCSRLIHPEPELAEQVHGTLLEVLVRHRSADARAHAAYRLADALPDDRRARDDVLDQLETAAASDASPLVARRARAALVTARRKVAAQSRG